jgi:hypothetical protein
VLLGDVDLEVGRDPWRAVGLSVGAIGLNAYNVDAVDGVCEEEERAHGDAVQQLWQRAQVHRAHACGPPSRPPSTVTASSRGGGGVPLLHLPHDLHEVINRAWQLVAASKAILGLGRRGWVPCSANGIGMGGGN